MLAPKRAIRMTTGQTKRALGQRPQEILTNFRISAFPFLSPRHSENNVALHAKRENERKVSFTAKQRKGKTLAHILSARAIRIEQNKSSEKTKKTQLRYLMRDYARLSMFAKSKKKYRRQLLRRQNNKKLSIKNKKMLKNKKTKVKRVTKTRLTAATKVFAKRTNKKTKVKR